MAPLDLEGDTLGEKHRQYNKLLSEAIRNSQPLEDFKPTDSDIENLLKIDVASHNKDVNYILNVLKCDDMLYVSRALSSSTWLVTDQQYANIINAEYLHTQLLPHMNTKAFIKLKKYIRHNIKDETRAEQFYFHEKKSADAVKWLPHCSVPFIEKNVGKHTDDDLNLRIFKRLSEKSIDIFEILIQNLQYYSNQELYAQTVTFLLKTDVTKFLNILDKKQFCVYPKFNEKATHLIMKSAPKRIFDNLERCIQYFDVPTLAKYLKPNEIKSFLYTKAKELDSKQTFNLHMLFRYDTLKYFIKRLPQTEQFDFVKKIFIDKEIYDTVLDNIKPDTEAYNMKKLCIVVKTPSYVWYRFATFQHAFEEITGLIAKDLDNQNKYSMLTVLLSCAEYNLQHIQIVLEYYLEKHKNDAYSNKLQFAIQLLKQSHIQQFDEKAWNLLNEIFKSIKMYEESTDAPSCTPTCAPGIGSDICVESIILYNVMRDQKVPVVIEKKFKFSTLKSYSNNLNQENKEKVFRYLYEYIMNKLNNPIVDEKDFSASIKTMENVLLLIRDWNKQITEFPSVIEKIKEFIKIRREHSWKESLASLYNFNKSWRKHMFEESVLLHPCEEVCLNALKHEPQLLARNNAVVETMRHDDAVSLRRLLAKLRVYWSQSLAQQWIDIYLQNLNKTDGHKATVRGLCTVLPEKPLAEIIDTYKPAEAKIDWTKVDDRVLNVQRVIAKNMHIARPQPSPEHILLYAKGDYLQFALPSLHAMFYNLSIMKSQQYIPKLLDSPVSVQKHGIRFAFQKLNQEDIKKLFSICWKASKNASIRAIIFKFTFELLCNEKESVRTVGLWELLEMFIDNLTFEEDKKIYELLSNVEKIPLNVRSNYLMKSYKFMENLLPKLKDSDRAYYEHVSAQLAQHCRDIIDTLNPDFVTGIIQEFIDRDFFGSENKFGYLHSSAGIIPVISAYLLQTKDENIQTEKYEKVFVPIMKRAFAMWTEKRDGNYIIKYRFEHLLTCLYGDLKQIAIEKKMAVPVKMFTNIQNELEGSLPVSENYLLLTQWKLAVAMAKLVDKSNKTEGTDWDTICNDIASEYGKVCLEYLKEDVKKHFLCIYKLFTKALDKICVLINSDDTKLVIYECLLSDSSFIQGYLTAMEISYKSYEYNKSTYNKLWEEILSHPSVEVKMHYYSKNRRGRQFFNPLLR